MKTHSQILKFALVAAVSAAAIVAVLLLIALPNWKSMDRVTPDYRWAQISKDFLGDILYLSEFKTRPSASQVNYYFASVGDGELKIPYVVDDEAQPLEGFVLQGDIWINEELWRTGTSVGQGRLLAFTKRFRSSNQRFVLLSDGTIKETEESLESTGPQAP